MWAILAVGVLGGGAIGLGAAALTNNDDEPPTMTLAPADTGVPADHLTNAQAFLAAWQRYRRGTFVVDLTFERTLSDGRSLTAQRVMVQRPPRRVVRQLGSVSSTDGGATVACDTVQDQTVCTPPASSDYEQTITAELAAWASAFVGDQPAYIVSAPEPNCFELQLARPIAAAPYGDVARFCFDAATGALRSRQVVRTSGTDTEEATRISATVTDADFAAAGG
jgi:hypothetical protein